MNSIEALSELIVAVRETEPEHKPTLRALKWAEKRLEVLRARAECRKAPFPTDLDQEPIVISWDEMVEDHRGIVCRSCGKKKSSRRSFCTACYIAIAGTKKALWMDHNYLAAFNRAFLQLKERQVA